MAKSKKVELLIKNPGLGLNTLISDAMIKSEESQDLQNIEFIESGCPSKRRGTATLGDVVGTRVRGLSAFYKADGTKLLLAMMGTTLRKLVTTTWTTITGVTFTDNLDANIVQARDAMYIHNGTDDMGKYDGTTLSQPTTGVKAKFGIFYSGYHICAGNPTYPSRLYISNPLNAADFTGSSGTASAGAASTLTDSTKAWGTNDFANMKIIITSGTGAGQERTIISNTSTVITVGTAWATQPDATSQYKIASGNYVDISKDDGDKITGLGKFQEFLIVFKERSIHQMSFDTSGIPTLKPINVGKGCVSHRSITNVENDLYFLSRTGVQVLGNEPNFLNVIRVNDLSARVTNEIDIITDANLDKCTAIYNDYKYMLAIPQGGTTYNNVILVYDKRYTCWSKWTGLNVNSFATFIDANNAEHLYYADDNSGKVKEMYQGYDDDGVAYTAYWTSKSFDLDEFDRMKRWDWVRFLFRRIYGTVKVDFIIDGDTITKTVTLGSSNSASGGIGTDTIGLTLIGEDGNTGDDETTSAQTTPWEGKINKKGRQLKIKVYNENLNESFTLLEFKLKAKVFGASNFDSSRRY